MYHQDCLVATQYGMRRFSDINVGDLLLTRSKSGVFGMTPVKSIDTFLEKEGVHILGEEVDMLFSRNHNVFFQKGQASLYNSMDTVLIDNIIDKPITSFAMRLPVRDGHGIPVLYLDHIKLVEGDFWFVDVNVGGNALFILSNGKYIRG